MRTIYLAALTALLTGHTVASARQSDPLFAGGPPDISATGQSFGPWATGEYLLWWFKSAQVPPLVTAGGDGKLGSPGTRVLVDNLDFDDDARHGGRFAFGCRFESALGVEGNFLFLPGQQGDVQISSDGDPLLAQPFVNAVTGQPDAQLIAKAGLASGSVTIAARTALWGAEANVSAGLSDSDTFRLSALGGFRFLRLEDELTSTERFAVAPSVPGFGGNRVILQDEFRAANSFYGGQVGVAAGGQFGLVTIDFRGTIGIGLMRQVAEVNGAFARLGPDGSTTLFQGGLYALGSNIGRRERDELAFLPELGVNVGVQATERLKLYVGYSFLWVSTVGRAGGQIDPRVNVAILPLRSGEGPLVEPLRPEFRFGAADFWAQGLSFGVELRY